MVVRFALLVLIVGTIAGGAWWMQLRAEWRARKGTCERCGYSRAGIVGATCPECGATHVLLNQDGPTHWGQRAGPSG